MKPVIANFSIGYSIIKLNFWKTYSAKAGMVLLKDLLYIFSPPAFIPEFYYIVTRWIDLGEYVFKLLQVKRKLWW